MSDLKQTVIEEVEPIKQQLIETVHRLESVPRSSTASKRLAVIVNKIDSWQKENGSSRRPTFHAPFSGEELRRANEAYELHGYFALSDREKEIMEWIDRHYHQKQA